MSENLHLVRSIITDCERGDYSSVDWADPEIEYVIVDGPSPGHWMGLSEIWRAWSDILGAWENFRMEAEEYREIGDERVLVFHRASGRGKTSGLDIAQVGTKGGASVFHIRDGKVTRFVGCFDRDRALADLGLEV
jgi:hypothetical protein